MRTRVLHSQELAGDVRDIRFCLVFPRESLSIPVMRHVLGDTLAKLGLDEACVSDLLLAVTETRTNVASVNARVRKDKVGVINLVVDIRNVTQLTAVMQRIGQLPEVYRVERVAPH